MADGGELDFFDVFVFDRDEEAGGQQTEPQEEQPPEQPEEDIPLIDLTADSDDDGASNLTPAVVQQDQSQRSGEQPRSAQPGRMREPAADSEDSSDDEASSSSRRRSVKTGARKGNVYSLESITFSQLERKDKDAAQRVLACYRDERQQGLVHVCSRFISGKCRYMTKDAREVSKHIKCQHPNAKHPGYKITQYPGFKDHKANDFVTKPFSELKQTHPQLAEEVLALYKQARNKTKKKVHLCGHFVRGKCQYLSISTGHVKCHMARKHSRTLPIIKIVGYPGERERTRHKYEQMTYAELKSKRSKVADEVLKHYYEANCRKKVHLCGSCDYFSNHGVHLRGHIALHHPPTTAPHKIIQYPRVELN